MIMAFLIGFLVGVVCTALLYLKAEEEAYIAGFKNGRGVTDGEKRRF